MKKNKSIEAIPNEVLLRIFTALNVLELAVVSMVSKSWNQASRDPSLWDKIDLRRIYPNKLLPHNSSSTKITQFLKHVLSLSNGNTRCFIFGCFTCKWDKHIIYAAERTPNLKRLVLPSSGYITSGLDKAMKSWGGLESITITNNNIFYHGLLPAIGKYCKNVTKMDIWCVFEKHHAEGLIKNIPKLTTLKFGEVIVDMKVLRCVLNANMKHLEVVNLSHSLIWDAEYLGDMVKVYHIADLQKELDPSSFRKLVFCQETRCPRCKP
ncbi:hypothetical protein RJT34_17883 [Clitoria ternatea]|uniref:F-box domain-containing protein n=1 Tax=Clitoria ternatea TaxID=43366 RepID=A0AAN9JA57_CLITE